MVRKEKSFPGLFRTLWSLVWIIESYCKIVCVMWKVLQSFTVTPKFSGIVKVLALLIEGGGKQLNCARQHYKSHPDL